MAILNIANKYDEKYLEDKLKLIFTRDKHIVTHGIDFLADYTPDRTYNYMDSNNELKSVNHSRGLVPNYELESDWGFLGRSGWQAMTTDLTNITEEDGSVPTSHAIKNYLETTFSESIKAAETMKFKGVIGYKDNHYYHQPINSEGEVNGFIPSGELGDVYRAATSLTVNGKICEAGDLLLCIETHSGIKESAWHVIQTNIQGTQGFSFNGGDTYNLYTSGVPTSTINIYAPTTPATSQHQIIGSNSNKNATWLYPSLTYDNAFIKFTTSDTTNEGLESYYFYQDITSKHYSKLGVTTSFDLTDSTSTTFNEAQGAFIVRLDKEHKGFVYIPTVSKTCQGLAPIIPETVDTAISDLSKEWVLSVDNTGAPAWKKLPAQVEDKDTWRPITIADTSLVLDDDDTLNFIRVENGSIGIIANKTTNNTVNLGFDLCWFDLDKNEYEENNQ